MALPLTDTFTGASGTLADPPYHNMRAGTSAMQQDGSGNAVSDSASRDTLCRDDANTYGNDHYIEATLGANLSAGAAYLYLIVRATGEYSTGNYYWFWTDGNGDTAVVKSLGGTETGLTTDATFTAASGDTIRLTISGNQIQVLKNGIVASALTATDSSIASGGVPGFGCWNSSAQGTKITSITADNVAAADTLMGQICT